MQKMSPIQSVPIELKIRSGRIPVQWTVREISRPELRDIDGRVLDQGGTERVFWPQVVKTGSLVEVTEIEDPLVLRVQLFKLLNTNRTEEAALDFLERVGAWQIVLEDKHETWTRGMCATVAFKHRQIVALRVLPLTLDDLLRDIEYWYRLQSVRNPSKLKAEFRQPPPTDARPADRFAYAGEAEFRNTLQVSLEWHGKDPCAVIETVTASELLIAAAWSDVVSRAEPQVCDRCQTRFTWPRKKKYCLMECGHLVAVRKYKRKMALKNRKKKALRKKTPRLSIPARSRNRLTAGK